MTLKNRILELVQQRDYVSFAELARHFKEEFQGGRCEITKGENVIIWSDMTEAGATAVQSLLDERAIHLWPADMLVYLVDGTMLKLPLVKSRRKYKTPHWLPTTMRTVALKKAAK